MQTSGATGAGALPPTGVHGSRRQFLSQPSPSHWLPSSHCSPQPTVWSPQAQSRITLFRDTVAGPGRPAAELIPDDAVPGMQNSATVTGSDVPGTQGPTPQSELDMQLPTSESSVQ